MVAELLVDVDLLFLTTKSAVRRSSGGFGLGSADCVRGAGASAVTIVNCMPGPLSLAYFDSPIGNDITSTYGT
jgi:hypothetical protein